jgi:hypothetical protein
MGMGEGFSNIFTNIILELDANDTPLSLRRQMVGIRNKYRIEPTDDIKTKQFKQKQSGAERKELQIRMKAARNRDDYENSMDDKEQDNLNNDQEDERNTQGKGRDDRGTL